MTTMVSNNITNNNPVVISVATSLPSGFCRKARTQLFNKLDGTMGATIHNSVGKHVTHVVAGSDGTDKVRWARTHGAHAVSIDWLAKCGYLWRCVDERSARIDGLKPSKSGPGRKLPEQLSGGGTTMAPPELAPQVADALGLA